MPPVFCSRTFKASDHLVTRPYSASGIGPVNRQAEGTEMKRKIMAAGLLTLALIGAAPARAELTREQVLAAVPELQRMAQSVIDRGGVPGLSVAVVFDDEVVYLGGFGHREIGRPETVDPDTVFQIASCSKPISSSVVAALVSQGNLSWDTRIADIDPEFQLHDAYPSQQVTVADLFAHRSGLPGDAGNELEEIGYERATILHRLRLVTPASSFRADYSYSNFGLTEGASAAARAAGLSWEDAADQFLIRPLGMPSTSYRHADFLARTNRAALHVPIASIAGAWQATVKRDPDPQAPAGGVSSNARDLAQWMRLELGAGVFNGKRLIDTEAIARTHAPVTWRGPDSVSHAPAFYALGWNLSYSPRGVIWGHSGAFSTGARSVMELLPEARLGIMVLANAFPSGVPEGLAESFIDLATTGHLSRDWLTAWHEVFASLFDPGRAQFGVPPDDPAPALELSAYAGRYANAYVGNATVTEQDGALTLSLGPNGNATYILRHFQRDVFSYSPSPEMPDLLVPATFQIGPDGKASQVTLDSVNGVGLGTLARAN
jgi:CubicO group peptidase (beta-lactamase class C family)